MVGTAGWQLPEEEEGGRQAAASPPAIPTIPCWQGPPMPCTTEYWVNEASVAPGVGNRLHSLHSSHPVPLGPRHGGMGVQRLLRAPVPAGSSGLGAGKGLSWTLSLERGPAAQTCSGTPLQEGSVFSRVLQSPALKHFVHGLCPETDQQKG